MVQTIDGIDALRTREAVFGLKPEDCWNEVDLLTLPEQRFPGLLSGFAASDRMVELALRLRYEVFNLELGEGLGESIQTGLDRDEFDSQMTHIVVLDTETQRPVGTYRLQTVNHAQRHAGIYSAREYNLEPLVPLFPSLVETGRACIGMNHRNVFTLLSLWDAIAVFVRSNGARFLFGCCSLTSTDPDDGWRALKTIRKEGYLHPEFHLRARTGFECGDPEREFSPEIGERIRLPKLFSVYMNLGAQVLSEPAIDREFGTVDFLVMMDSEKANFVL